MAQFLAPGVLARVARLATKLKKAGMPGGEESPLWREYGNDNGDTSRACTRYA
jgi:hypothetical protein